LSEYHSTKIAFCVLGAGIQFVPGWHLLLKIQQGSYLTRNEYLPLQTENRRHSPFGDDDSAVLDLTAAGITQMFPLLEDEGALSRVQVSASKNLPRFGIAEVQFCAPVERQEVWAAGVTYLRSKAARMKESDFSASAYDRVYVAERPELFFKSLRD
jgi:hypothetical protein